MGLRRRIVKALLKKYVKNLQERHIHVSVARGVVRVDDAVLEVAPLAELLLGLLPDGWEIAEAKASDLRLDIPWKNLKSRSTTISIGEVSVSVRQHPTPADGFPDDPSSYWAAALKLRKQMLHEAQVLARKGLLPIGGNDVASAIAAGLQVNIDMLNVEITKCPCACRNESTTMPPVEPHAMISIADFFIGPVDQRLQRLTTFSQSDGLAYQLKDIRAGAVSLRVRTGGQMKKLLHPTALKMKLWRYMPSDGKVVCPFASSMRLEVDIDTLCVDGDEEQVQALLRTIIDFSDAMEVQRRALGAIPWSNEDYARCYGEDKKASTKKGTESQSMTFSLSQTGIFDKAQSGIFDKAQSGMFEKAISRRPSTGSIANLLRRKGSRPSSPTGSVAGSEAGSVAGSVVSKGSKSGIMRRFLPSTSLLTRKTHHTAHDAEVPTSPSASHTAFLLDDLEAEDSDTYSGVEEDSNTASKSDEVECGENLDFHTPMAAGMDIPHDEQMAASSSESGSDSSSEESAGQEHLRSTWNVGSFRQDTITVDVGTLRLGVLFPAEGRAEVTVTKLSYKQVCRAWLSEAEQICATRVGGRFENATAAPGFERGGNSVDTIINIEHQLSARTCRFIYSDFGKQETDAEMSQDCPSESQCQLQLESGTDSVLVEPLTGKEENIKVRWRSACGEPCRDIQNDNMFVWPLEVVVRGLRLLYLPAPFERLQEAVKPVIAEMVSWDEEGQVAGNRARAAKWSKTVSLKNVAVQQSVEGKELPHRVKIQDATLENVTSNFDDIGTFLGLVREEEKADTCVDKQDIDYKAKAGIDVDVKNMSEEQLRAEVMMWRYKHGACNGEQHVPKEESNAV
jgi:hypothetical protein